MSKLRTDQTKDSFVHLQIARGDVVPFNDLPFRFDYVLKADIDFIAELGFREGDDGAISTSTADISHDCQ